MPEKDLEKEIEEIIIHSDLYQTFIGEYVDYSSMEKKLAQALATHLKKHYVKKDD